MADYGIWQGLERGTANMANTGMQLLQYQGQRADADARMGLLEKQDQRQQAAFDYNMQKQQQADAADKAFRPVSAIAPNLSRMPKFKTAAIGAMKTAGIDVRETPDGEVYLNGDGLRFAQQMLSSRSEFSKVARQTMMEDLTDQSMAIQSQIMELEQKGGDEKKLAPLMQKQMQVKQHIAGILSAMPENIQAEMGKPPKQIVLSEGAQLIQDGKVIAENKKDPSSGKGYSDKISLSAKAVGVDSDRVRSGDITAEEAVKILAEYKKQFGAESLIQMLLSNMNQGGAVVPAMRFDANGEPVTE